MKVSVILPSYNPGKKLPEAVNKLIMAGFDDIIVVNDGSRDDCIHFFDEISNEPYVTVINHEKNMGKGCALKTAFQFFLDNRNDI